MNIFEVIGPVMVGPSSSHTAGAVRIGETARRLLGEEVKDAVIRLHGSFLSTGRGHGTDKAIVAGLLGFNVDDLRIPDSLYEAQKRGMFYRFEGCNLGDVHPNSCELLLTGIHGAKLQLQAASIGGGRIEIHEIDGLKVSFSGSFPTLIVQDVDIPGHIADVTTILKDAEINIAYMELTRESRGGHSAMVIECDQEISKATLKQIREEPGVIKVIYLSLSQKGGQR